MTYKAVFIGIQEEWLGIPPVPLFNIVAPDHPLYKSTVSLRTLFRQNFRVEEVKWYKS